MRWIYFSPVVHWLWAARRKDGKNTIVFRSIRSLPQESSWEHITFEFLGTINLQERNKFPEENSHLDQQIHLMKQSLLPEETTKACQGDFLMRYMQLHFNTGKNKSSTVCPVERCVSSLFSQCGSICLHYFMRKQMLGGSALQDFHLCAVLHLVTFLCVHLFLPGSLT